MWLFLSRFFFFLLARSPGNVSHAEAKNMCYIFLTELWLRERVEFLWKLWLAFPPHSSKNLWFKEKSVSYLLLIKDISFFKKETSNSDWSQSFQLAALSHFTDIKSCVHGHSSNKKTIQDTVAIVKLCKLIHPVCPPEMWNVKNKNKTLNSSLASIQRVLQTLQRQQSMNVVCSLWNAYMHKAVWLLQRRGCFFVFCEH